MRKGAHAARRGRFVVHGRVATVPTSRREPSDCIYDILVLLEYDDAKSARNRQLRGIGFDRFADVDTATALAIVDSRRDYGEVRVRVMGYIDLRLHVAVVTRRDSVVRVISLRRANQREERHYAKARESA